nr:DNA translocase FtsK [uncultured Gellertiella sp.]
MDIEKRANDLAWRKEPRLKDGEHVQATGAGARSADEIAASEIEGRDALPVWQNAFTLSPNVRFSRTPEAALTRKSAAEAPEIAAQAVPLPPEPVAGSEPENPPSAQVQSIDPALPLQANSIGPETLEHHAAGIRAITYRLRQEFSAASPRQPLAAAPMAASPVPTTPVVSATPMRPHEIEAALASLARSTFAAAPAMPQRTPQPAAPYAAYLSDHVFWEAMGAGEGEDDGGLATAAPVSTRPAGPAAMAAIQAIAPSPEPPAAPSPMTLPGFVARPPAVQIPPTAQPDGWSVTALYRSVDVRPAPAPAPAPMMIEPVEETAIAAVPDPATRSPETEPAMPQPASRPARPAPMLVVDGEYELPPVDLLQVPQIQEAAAITPEALEQNAGLLESVLEDFGIKGEIIDVRPGPVVTLYEFEPAPGVKSSRVIGLSDDIARSMSALSARVAVIPGRNVIGIELPNPIRETVYFRELIESEPYTQSRFHLPVCLGKTIGGEPVIAELSKMPHLLVAGTTGSGKSVAINTMILSLLYRLKPEECRLIMVDPKMLELSVYDGIPHLLTPVVTDPKKAVMALKWAVREMEDRYRKMSRLGVRNIDGYNARAATARAKGETILCSVQTGFDRSTGEIVYEQEEMDLTAMPYIVVIVDEMADLMMVAGKEIEGAIQRLAQMARAAGIHLIMATQRPSVDVITGTIKANFPTRISFQVTSKIDSRTILGEPGAEHLLGQGDMLHMVGGGRIARVHGPFVSDYEVEKVVAHLKTQGRPEYLGTVTEDADEIEEVPEDDGAVFDKSAMAEEDSNDLYDKAVKLVMRDKKCSTSYIQRRLAIGYNKAASLVERMEKEGLVGPANHVGKRTIIAGGRDITPPRDMPEVPGADSDD